MNRRITRTALRLAEVPRPLDAGAEILNAIDARQKLQLAIAAENRKRDAAEIEFARSMAREISSGQVVNVDAVFQRDVAARSSAERFKQRLEALQNTLARVNKRIEQLKSESPDDVNAALTKRIEALEKTLSEKEAADRDLKYEINLLKSEIVKPLKAPIKKAGE